jgi:hypothetical protein
MGGSGGDYEMETFKTISGDVEDNERPNSSYDTTHLMGDALSEIQGHHLKDAVDTRARTIKKAYQYTGQPGRQSTTSNSVMGVYTSKTDPFSLQIV